MLEKLGVLSMTIQLLSHQTLRPLRGINSMTQLNKGPCIQYHTLEKINVHERTIVVTPDTPASERYQINDPVAQCT